MAKPDPKLLAKTPDPWYAWRESKEPAPRTEDHDGQGVHYPVSEVEVMRYKLLEHY